MRINVRSFACVCVYICMSVNIISIDHRLIKNLLLKLPPSQSKAKISLNQCSFGPCFGMDVV